MIVLAWKLEVVVQTQCPAYSTHFPLVAADWTESQLRQMKQCMWLGSAYYGGFRQLGWEGGGGWFCWGFWGSSQLLRKIQAQALILFILRRMNAYDPKSTIGIALPHSGNDLKYLKKQVLRQAYDLQLTKPSKMTFSTNPEDNLDQFSGSRSVRSSKSLALLPSISTPQSVSTIFPRELTQKSNEKKLQQRQRIMQERDLLVLFQQQARAQQQKQRQVKESYKMHLQEEISRKNSQRQMLRREESQMEANRVHRKSSLINKVESFKQYYEHVNKVRDSVAQEYLAYVQQETSRRGNSKDVDNASREKQSQLLQMQSEQERKAKVERKAELRQALQQQMEQNRSFKSRELSDFKNRGYVSSERNLYNPISNPIDFKMDINNKYVLSQIIDRNLTDSRSLQL